MEPDLNTLMMDEELKRAIQGAVAMLGHAALRFRVHHNDQHTARLMGDAESTLRKALEPYCEAMIQE